MRLTINAAGHQIKVLNSLQATGWRICKLPEDARLVGNGQRYILSAPGHEIRIRLFIYKVTGSGRARPNERRIQITTTYKGGLKKELGFHDVVIGYNEKTLSFVGVDPRRLNFGGATHNASSFFDLEGIKKTSDQRLLVMSRGATRDLFPTEIEYHAFFNQSKIAEYLYNFSEIHNGTYASSGLFSGAIKLGKVSIDNSIDEGLASGSDVHLMTSRKPQAISKIDNILVAAVEESNFKKLKRAKLTPEELREILRHCEEIGALAEQFVVEHERRRLTKLGHVGAAGNVERVSLTSVGEGYDIISFEDDGITRRFLEVKGTTGTGMTVDMSNNEWETAKQLKQQYYLVRVVSIKTRPSLSFHKNPVAMEQGGMLKKLPTGWRVTLPKQK